MRNLRSAGGVLAALAVPLTLVLGGLSPAAAAALPSCATAYHCTANSYAGPEEAGYYGKNDNHTHYRFVQTTVQAEPTLGNQDTGQLVAGAGAELCDPDTGFAAQTGLIDDGGTYAVLWAYGSFPPGTLDPCIQSGLLTQDVTLKNGTVTCTSGNGVTCGVLSLGTIAAGDHVYAGVYYDPAGRHFHQISFGDCVTETGNCAQAWDTRNTETNFYEFGIGAFSPQQLTGAPADNLLDTFTGNDVTCYSCKGMVPITAVSPVNPIGAGGLYEAQVVNGSSQVVMSPDDSLSAGDAFTVYNGSTS